MAVNYLLSSALGLAFLITLDLLNAEELNGKILGKEGWGSMG